MNHLTNGTVAVGAPGSIARKVAELKDGCRVITYDDELDAMMRFDSDTMNHVATVPNPHRVGLKDQYIAWDKRVNASSLYFNPEYKGKGCGKMTHVEGTNGGKMPCGAKLDGKPYYCAACESAGLWHCSDPVHCGQME
jgi:hypothetical protein